MTQEQRETTDREREISIHLDGVALGLSPFVREIFARVILAMLGALKGVDAPRQIEISIRVKEGPSS